MNRIELYADVRRKVGGPSLNDVTNEELRPYVEGALEWLASELSYRIVTETQAIKLVAGQRDYPMPDDVVEMIQVFWNSKALTAKSVDAWDRERTDWRHVASGNPTEYAIEGRRLFLTPPPSATAITTDSTLETRYVAAPATVPPGGPHELPVLDHRLAAWRASWEWLAVHPTEENIARAQGYEKIIFGPNGLLPGARRRAQAPTRNHRPRWRPDTYRSGAAR